MTTALATRNHLADLIPAIRDSVISQKTKDSYLAALARFIDWNGGHELERTRVLQYRQYLLDQGLSSSSVNIALTAIRRLAEEAEAQGMLSERATGLILAVAGVPTRGVKFGNWLTVEQALEMLTLPNQRRNGGLRDFVALGLMMGCGLRRDEAIRLQTNQVQRRGLRLVLVDVEGKGRKLRSCVVPKWLEEPLRLWIKRVGDGPVLRWVNRGDNIQGQHGMRGISLWERVVMYAKLAGVQCTPHDLRRTFALQSMEGGANLEAIRQALGHSSLSTTTRYVAAGLSLKNPACDYVLGGK